MGKKNLFDWIKDMLRKPAAAQAVYKEDFPYSGALTALSSEKAYMTFAEDLYNSGKENCQFDLPNGRSLVFDTRKEGIQAEGHHKILFLVDNDGSRYYPSSLDASDFGSPESIVENCYLRQLNETRLEDSKKTSSMHQIIEAMVNKTIEANENQFLRMPNGQKLVFQRVGDGINNYNAISIVLADERRFFKNELFRAEMTPNPTSNNRSILGSLDAVQKYYDKVIDVRNPELFRNIIETTLNKAVDLQETLYLNLPDGSKLQFEPVTLNAKECDYHTCKINQVDKEGNCTRTLFEEKLPAFKNIDELITFGSLESIQKSYENQVKSRSSLDGYISEKSSVQTCPNELHTTDKPNDKEDIMIA